MMVMCVKPAESCQVLVSMDLAMADHARWGETILDCSDAGHRRLHSRWADDSIIANAHVVDAHVPLSLSK